MLGLPGPGIEPVSPALAGGFLTTAPPGKSLVILFFFQEILAIFIVALEDSQKTNMTPFPIYF